MRIRLAQMSELIKTPKDRIPKAWIELSRERELPSSVLRFIVRVGKATAGKDIAIDKDNLHEAKVALEFLNDCERSEARIKRIKAAVGIYERKEREAERQKKIAGYVGEIMNSKKGAQFIPAFSTKDPLRHEAICECVLNGALVRREWIGWTRPYFYVRA